MYIGIINTLFHNVCKQVGYYNIDDYSTLLTDADIIAYYKKLFEKNNLNNFNRNEKKILSYINNLNNINLLRLQLEYDKYLSDQQYINIDIPICLRSYYKNENQIINKILNFIRFNKISILFSICYTIVNIIAFISTFMHFYTVQYYMMENIKIYKSIAKSSASIILLNTFISIFPLITYRFKIINYIYFPHYLNLVLHYLCFGMIVIFAIIHAICHFIILHIIYELSNICVYNALELDKLGVDIKFNSYLKLLPVWSGILLIMIMIGFFILWILLKYKKIRHSIFYNYHLAIVILYFLFLLLHGSLNWLGPSQTIYWIILPIGIYLFDKYKKIFHIHKLISCYAQVSNDFIKLTIVKTTNIIKYMTEPSMTLDIKIPIISKFEWHKFTITTSPNDDYLVLYIRSTGKWTNKLKSYIINNSIYSEMNLILYADKITNNVIKYTSLYNILLLVCTGYGITPYISLIRDVIYNPNKYKNVKQINIIWIINNDADCNIFDKTLNGLFNHEIFNLQIYFTKNIIIEDLEQIKFLQYYIHNKNNFDIISGLTQKNKTIMSKPNFNIILQEILKNNISEKSIGVFFCGNDMLQKKLLKKCYKYSNNTLDIQLNFHSVG